MKNRIAKVIVCCLSAMLLFAAAGCFPMWIARNGIVGNGVRDTREVTLEKTLSGIRSMSVIDIEFDPTLTDKIVLEGDENILPLVTAEQGTDGVVTLSFEEQHNISLLSNVVARVPYIDGGLIETSSTGSVRMADSTPLKGERFTLRINSTGGMNLILEADELQISSMSTGSFRLSGSTKRAEIELGSTGSFEGFDLIADDVKVSVMSTGSAQVYATNSLNATIMSTGSVIYDGDPAQVSVEDSSIGKLRPR